MKKPMSAKTKKILINTGITAAFPVAMFLVLEIILACMGTHIIASGMDLKDIIRNTAVSCFIAYGLSFNLTCGRMDLSLGAQRLAGVIIGGNIALAIGLTGVGMLFFSVLFGFLFGFVTGMLFVLTRVPAMVLGVGVGLIYECLAFITSDGGGLITYGVAGLEILTNEWFSLAMIIIVCALTLFILGYTRYGYHLRAIQGSQRIAKSAGVNVFKNAVLSYTFAGGCVGLAGIIKAATSNGMSVAMGFTSNGSVMANMFPMFLGMYISRWSNQAVGILVSSLTLTLFSLGLSKFQLNDAQQNVVTMLLFLALLIYLANENVLRVRKARKARIALAREKLAAAAAPAAEVKENG